MASSITWQAIAGTTALMPAMPVAACRAPTRSISHAVRSTSRRAWSTASRDREIDSRTTPCAASGLPNAVRLAARRTMVSMARSAMPISRMQ